MSCCGQARAKAMLQAKTRLAQPPAKESVVFEYTGQTNLRLKGPVSGAIYQFEATGVRVPVDQRDAPVFASVRVLRRI